MFKRLTHAFTLVTVGTKFVTVAFVFGKYFCAVKERKYVDNATFVKDMFLRH